MACAVGQQRALVHATLLFLAFSTGVVADVPSCTLQSLLSSGTTSPSPGLSATIATDCLLLGPTEQSISVSNNISLSGVPGQPGSLDTQFAANVLVVTRPGLVFSLANHTLLNVRMEVDPFLQLSAFNGVKLQLSNITIHTDCNSLKTLSDVSLPASRGTVTRGTGYLHVANFTSDGVTVSNVNITCRLPQINMTSSGVPVIQVADSLQLMDALVASQLDVASGVTPVLVTILLVQNISLSTAMWRPKMPVVISRNVTITGDPATLTVLDLSCLFNMVVVRPGAGVRVDYMTLMNLSPLRALDPDLSILPMFSIPVWFFSYVRVPTVPQVNMTNVTLILPSSEIMYFFYWALVFSQNVSPQLATQAAALRATTPIIKAATQTETSIPFYQLMGTGLDLLNLTLTFVPPPVPFPNCVLNDPYLKFDFNILPNISHVPIYHLDDLVTVLSYIETNPPPFRSVLYLLSNITLDPAVWPSGGFFSSQPVLVVGLGSEGISSWINFNRLPGFIRVDGCAPENYLYVQGLELLNLPNALTSLPSATLDSGLTPMVEAAKETRLSDLTVFLTNFRTSRTCATPALFLNQSKVVITYAEFRLFRAALQRFIGNTKIGSGTYLNANISFNISEVVVDKATFAQVQGLTWTGTAVTLTYQSPDGLPNLYNNTYDPPSWAMDAYFSPINETGSPGPSGSTTDGDHGLASWQVALIVVGSVVLVALLTGLIAWRVVRRLRHEVEAVRSAASDKKSSTGSADQEAAHGGSRLGSSAMAGNGSNQGNGMPGSPLAAKGSQGAGGGTSDDSTALQYDRPPLEVLNSMMATLTQEMDDRHLNILEVIGQGGFGVVYRGMWKGLNVAVKTITFQDRVAGGEKAQHRAILEAAISSSLAHPNVVTTYSYDIKPLTVQIQGSGESSNSGQNGATNGNMAPGGGFKIIDKRPVLDWKLYLIQEYCDGGSLRTAILKRKFFDAKKGEPRMEMILDTCIELSGGLIHLHERNIIHGDLNPNNVLLKRDATKKYGAICKIADFGLSIKMNADQSHISNMRRGTPFYTCPQILARGNMTKAADVYSMGVMMWEMFHCCMSYRSLPTGFQARENFPNFPRKAPADFARVVGACLSAEPADRPNFTALRTELEAQLAALKRGELRSAEEVLGPDPAGDASHLAACQD